MAWMVGAVSSVGVGVVVGRYRDVSDYLEAS